MSAQMLAATAKKDAAATAGGTGPAGNPIGELLYCFFSHIFIFIFFFSIPMNCYIPLICRLFIMLTFYLVLVYENRKCSD